MEKDIGEIIPNLPEPYTEINFFYRPPQWTLKWHSHDYFQFIFMTGGTLDISFRDQTYSIEKGQLCIIPPGVEHTLNSPKGYTQLGINLNPQSDQRGMLVLLGSHIDKPLLHNRSDLFNYIQELERESSRLSQLSRHKIALILDNIMLTTVEHILSNDKVDFRNNLLTILKRDLTSGIKLQDICKELSLSQTHLERLARREFGCGVIEVFNQLKINQACALLSIQDKSVKEISDSLGFCDQAYFSKEYKIN